MIHCSKFCWCITYVKSIWWNYHKHTQLDMLSLSDLVCSKYTKAQQTILYK